MASLNSKGSLIAGVLTAIGASVSCVGPLLLLILGIGGAWVGTLTTFEPYRPWLIALTLVFLGFAFRTLYMVPQASEPGTPCANPQTIKRHRLIFWIVTVLVVGLLAVPTVAPLFYFTHQSVI
ncbi:MAG: mercuric transporter MerT family protein [Burkholderiales bacterium]